MVKLPLPAGLPRPTSSRPLFRRHPACPRKSRAEQSRTRVATSRGGRQPEQVDCRLGPLTRTDSAELVRPMRAPPGKQSKRDQHSSDEKYEQSGVGDPSDKRHRERKESAGDAKLPGPQVQSGNENSKRKQRQQNAPQRIVRDQAV